MIANNLANNIIIVWVILGKEVTYFLNATGLLLLRRLVITSAFYRKMLENCMWRKRARKSEKCQTNTDASWDAKRRALLNLTIRRLGRHCKDAESTRERSGKNLTVWQTSTGNNSHSLSLSLSLSLSVANFKVRRVVIIILDINKRKKANSRLLTYERQLVPRKINILSCGRQKYYFYWRIGFAWHTPTLFVWPQVATKTHIKFEKASTSQIHKRCRMQLSNSWSPFSVWLLVGCCRRLRLDKIMMLVKKR